VRIRLRSCRWRLRLQRRRQALRIDDQQHQVRFAGVITICRARDLVREAAMNESDTVEGLVASGNRVAANATGVLPFTPACNMKDPLRRSALRHKRLPRLYDEPTGTETRPRECGTWRRQWKHNRSCQAQPILRRRQSRVSGAADSPQAAIARVRRSRFSAGGNRGCQAQPILRRRQSRVSGAADFREAGRPGRRCNRSPDKRLRRERDSHRAH
jgi:hypothetical protein